MKKLIPFFLMLILLMVACDDDNGENSQGTTSEPQSDSTQLVTESPEASSPILGKWELVEKRIPDLGAIPLGNIYFTFEADGKVESTHDDDSGIGPEKSDYSFDGSSLYFNETSYKLISLEGDTLTLESDTDGITSQSIFLKK